MYNKVVMRDLRSVGLFCGKRYHKKFQLHSGAIQRRYDTKGVYGVKMVILFKLAVLMVVLEGCGGSEVLFNKNCFEAPECTVTEAGFVEFVDSVIACNDSQYFFYYGFGHAVVDSDPSPQCSADSNQPRMVTVKTEMELSDYSVYSCELNVIKTIDWREPDTAPPSSAIIDRCVFIGTEKQS